MSRTPGLRRLERAIDDAWSQGPRGVVDAVRRVLHDRDEHVLTVHEEPSHDDPTAPSGFTIEHTLDCRIQGLADCRYHAWVTERHGHGLAPGRYLLDLADEMRVTLLADDAVGLVRRSNPPLGGVGRPSLDRPRRARRCRGRAGQRGRPAPRPVLAQVRR